MKKRLLSLAMVLTMLLSQLPTAAFADEDQENSEPVCTCEELCGDYNSECVVCTEDFSQCKGVESESPSEPEEKSKVEQVQDLINALPSAEEVTEEKNSESPDSDKLEAWYEQYEVAATAYGELDNEEQEQVDTEKLMALYNVFYADVAVMTADMDGNAHTHAVDGGEGNVNWTGVGSLGDITTGGYYYLTQDVELSRTWCPVDGVYLCLNGYTIKSSGDQAIAIKDDISFTLTDCKNSGTVQNTNGNDKDAVLIRGTFNMYGGTLSSSNGRGVQLNGSSTFNMYGGSITGNNSRGAGGVWVNDNGSTFNMYGGSITNNTGSMGAGGVYVDEGTFNMSGGIITQNNSKGVEVGSSGTFTVSGSAVIKGNGTYNVYLDSRKVINIGGALSEGFSVSVNASAGTTFTSGWSTYMGSANPNAYFTSDSSGLAPAMVDGELQMQTAHSHGICGESSCSEHASQVWTGVSTLTSDMEAGYYYLTQDVELSSTWSPVNNINLCLNGHSIKNGFNGGSTISFENSSAQVTLTLTDCKSAGKVHEGTDSAISVKNNNVLNLYKVTITGETKKGKGVDVGSGATFNMYSGTIADGTQGVCVKNSSTFNMYGGEIKGNSTNGKAAGVYVGSGCAFNMSGGSITGNTAKSQGGGVNVDGGSFVMSGGSITNNTSGGYGGGGVDLEYGGTMTISGTIDISGNKSGSNDNNIQIANHVDSYSDTNPAIIIADKLIVKNAIGISNYWSNSEGYQGIFTSGWSTCMGDADYKQYFTNENEAFTLCKSGGELAMYTAHTHSDGTSDNETWTYINSLTEINGAGHYVLLEDVKLADSWTVPASGVYLCLNGHNITKTTNTAGRSIITVDAGNTFSLYDCKDSGKITHTKDGNGYGVYITGTFNMYGGSITGNSYGGVQVHNGGTFNMIGGSISYNSYGKGGGVLIENGSTFNMSGGTISNNSATSDGGGGVYIGNSCTFNMSGSAKITENTASSDGGGVFVDGNSSFTMSDSATISSNTANSKGGGVRVNSGSFTMSDSAKITDNTSRDNGGGVYVVDSGSKCSFTMTGGEICGNNANNGGGVFVASLNGQVDDIVTLTGGSISGNTASESGGGVYAGTMLKDSKLTIGGSLVITGNTSGNLYLASGSTISLADELSEAFTVGVTTADKPSKNQAVSITDSSSKYSASYTKYIVSDDKSYDIGFASAEEGGQIVLEIPSSTITTNPEARELTYSGDEQALVTEGTATGGTMMYSTDGENWSDSVPTATNVAKYTVYYKVAGDSDHKDLADADYVVNVEIGKKTLAVTANPQTKKYSESDPELTYTYDGLAENDSFTGELTREAGEKVGEYAITQGTLSAGDNYLISFTGAKLTITANSGAVITTTTSGENDSTISVAEDDSGSKVTTVTNKDGTKVVTTTDSQGKVTEKRTYAANGSYVKDGYKPTLIEGNGSTYSRFTSMTFRSDDELVNFLNVYVDGNTLGSGNYTVESGSIKVILKSSYLETLAAGTHSISIESTNGQATGTFTIAPRRGVATGDSSNLDLWLVTMAVSGLAIGGGAMLLRKKKKDN